MKGAIAPWGGALIAAMGAACSGQPTATPTASPSSAFTATAPAATASPVLGLTVSGRAWDVDGAPLTGVTITVEGAAPTLTDADGAYVAPAIPLPSGPVRVTAHLDGYTPSQRVVTFSGDTTTAAVFYLMPLSTHVFGSADAALRLATDDGLLFEVDPAHLMTADGTSPSPSEVRLRAAVATASHELRFAPEDGQIPPFSLGLAWLSLETDTGPLTLNGEARVCLPPVAVVSAEAMNLFALSEGDVTWSWVSSGQLDFTPQRPCITFATSRLGAVGLAAQAALPCVCGGAFRAGMEIVGESGESGVVVCGGGDVNAPLRVAWAGVEGEGEGEGDDCICPSESGRAGLPDRGVEWVSCGAVTADAEALSPCGIDVSCWDLDGDGFALGADCDDENAAIYPGALERCDGGEVDEDCDGLFDEGLQEAQRLDQDGDGFADALVAPTLICPPIAGYTTRVGDCDDSDPNISPAAGERCDEVDNNCNGEVDEGVTLPAYPDNDGDGFGANDDLMAVCDLSQAPGFVLISGDCDDSDDGGGVHPGVDEICDEVDQDCDGVIDEGAALSFYPDTDGDGFGAPGDTAEGCAPPEGFAASDDDCDPDDKSVYPGAVEAVDGADQDCDGVVDEETIISDDDGDGFCEGDVCLGGLPGGDCDDDDGGVSPAGEELSYALGEACVSFNADLPSAGVTSLVSGAFAARFTAERTVALRRLEVLTAGRGGIASVALWTVAPQSGAPGEPLATSEPFALGEASAWYGRDFTTAPTIVGGEAYYLVFRFSAGAHTLPVALSGSGGAPLTWCAAVDPDAAVLAWSCANEAPWQLRIICEGCDGIDGDCDGIIDEDVASVAWPDDDGDGFGDDDGDAVSGCPIPLAYAPASGDCDDSDAEIHPAAIEVFGTQVDEDCDGAIDETLEEDTPAPCVDVDLGSSVGAAVYVGSTALAGDDTAPSVSCSVGVGGDDLALAWVAPEQGLWRVDTFGSEFDTILYALNACGGVEVACNDDADVAPDPLASELRLNLEAGEALIFVVDGFTSADQGAFTLNIQRE